MKLCLTGKKTPSPLHNPWNETLDEKFDFDFQSLIFVV